MHTQTKIKVINAQHQEGLTVNSVSVILHFFILLICRLLFAISLIYLQASVVDTSINLYL